MREQTQGRVGVAPLARASILPRFGVYSKLLESNSGTWRTRTQQRRGDACRLWPARRASLPLQAERGQLDGGGNLPHSLPLEDQRPQSPGGQRPWPPPGRSPRTRTCAAAALRRREAPPAAVIGVRDRFLRKRTPTAPPSLRQAWAVLEPGSFKPEGVGLRSAGG